MRVTVPGADRDRNNVVNHGRLHDAAGPTMRQRVVRLTEPPPKRGAGGKGGSVRQTHG